MQYQLVRADARYFLAHQQTSSAQLVFTSPPYNIGKAYEKRQPLDRYIELQRQVIAECTRVLKPGGSIVWQIGNYVENGTILPLDSLFIPIFRDFSELRLRNRVIWGFEHGLHCSRRFSGRHETLLWYTKGDDYYFNLDPIRVPQKYPQKKHYKGPKRGQFSGNPRGKSPGDLWMIPNVKHNHVEKTIHPCQFPVELVERFVLATTHEGDIVLDPFMGVGTTIVAAVRHQRIGAGSDKVAKYVEVAKQRVTKAIAGTLKTRPMDRPIYAIKATA